MSRCRLRTLGTSGIEESDCAAGTAGSEYSEDSEETDGNETALFTVGSRWLGNFDGDFIFLVAAASSFFESGEAPFAESEPFD